MSILERYGASGFSRPYRLIYFLFRIKNKKDFNKSLYLLSLDKKKLTEKEYKLKYGELN